MSKRSDAQFWRTVASAVKASAGSRYNATPGSSGGGGSAPHRGSGVHVGQSHIHLPKVDEFGKPRMGLTEHPAVITHLRIKPPYLTRVEHYPGLNFYDSPGPPAQGLDRQGKPVPGLVGTLQRLPNTLSGGYADLSPKYDKRRDRAVGMFGPAWRMYPEIGVGLMPMPNMDRTNDWIDRHPYRNQINYGLAGGVGVGTLFWGGRNLLKMREAVQNNRAGLPQRGYRQPMMQNAVEVLPRTYAMLTRGFRAQPGDPFYGYVPPGPSDTPLPPAKKLLKPPKGLTGKTRYERLPDGRIWDNDGGRFVLETQARARINPHPPALPRDPWMPPPAASRTEEVLAGVAKLLRGTSIKAAPGTRILTAHEAHLADEAARLAGRQRITGALRTTGRVVRGAGRFAHEAVEGMHTPGGLTLDPSETYNAATQRRVSWDAVARDLSYFHPELIRDAEPLRGWFNQHVMAPRTQARYAFSQHLATKASAGSRYNAAPTVRSAGHGGGGPETPVWPDPLSQQLDYWRPTIVMGLGASMGAGAATTVTHHINKARDKRALAFERRLVPGGIGPVLPDLPPPARALTAFERVKRVAVRGPATTVGSLLAPPSLWNNPYTGKEPGWWQSRMESGAPDWWVTLRKNWGGLPFIPPIDPKNPPVSRSAVRRVPVQTALQQPDGPPPPSSTPPTPPKGLTGKVRYERLADGRIWDNANSRFVFETQARARVNPPASPHVPGDPFHGIPGGSSSGRLEEVLGNVARALRRVGPIKSDLGPYGFSWDPFDPTAFEKSMNTGNEPGLMVRGRPVRLIRAPRDRRRWPGCGMKAYDRGGYRPKAKIEGPFEKRRFRVPDDLFQNSAMGTSRASADTRLPSQLRGHPGPLQPMPEGPPKRAMRYPFGLGDAPGREQKRNASWLWKDGEGRALMQYENLDDLQRQSGSSRLQLPPQPESLQRVPVRTVLRRASEAGGKLLREETPLEQILRGVTRYLGGPMKTGAMKADGRRKYRSLGPPGPTATPEQRAEAARRGAERDLALHNQPPPSAAYFERQSDPPHGPTAWQSPPRAPRYHLMADGHIVDASTGEIVGAVKPPEMRLPRDTILGPGGRLIDPAKEPPDYKKLPLGDPRRVQGTVGWVRRGKILPRTDDPIYESRAAAARTRLARMQQSAQEALAPSPAARLPVSELERTLPPVVARQSPAAEMLARVTQLLRRSGPVKAALTTRTRNHLPDSAFALPGRRYPIQNPAHARSALAFGARHATPAELDMIRRKVHARYPGIAIGGAR